MNSRIAHHVSNEAGSLKRILFKHFKLDDSSAQRLLDFGAIYSNKERVFEDREVERGTYLRIHLEPKRYAIEGKDWRSMIVYETDDFMVVNKPAGVPVHATVDNIIENVLHQLRVVTGVDLLVTQRLDVPAAGLFILAKTPRFQTLFNKWLGERRIQKRYRALTSEPPPIGKLVHYMEPGEYPPKKVSKEPQKSGNADWILCELSILEVNPITFPGFERPFYESLIDLHTGRTHQIRAQLGELDLPLLGDKMYGSKFPFHKITGSKENIALFASEIGWELPHTPKQSFSQAPYWSVVK